MHQTGHRLLHEHDVVFQQKIHSFIHPTLRSEPEHSHLSFLSTYKVICKCRYYFQCKKLTELHKY